LAEGAGLHKNSGGRNRTEIRGRPPSDGAGGRSTEIRGTTLYFAIGAAQRKPASSLI
jgi:hypothetical protein